MAILNEEFERGDSPRGLIGYRVMRYDPKTQQATSGADSRHSVALKVGGVMKYGEGHFLTNDPQYAKDYYGAHDNNVLIKAEFDPADVTSGSIEDNQPEISVSKSIIIGWETFIDPDLEESAMSNFDKRFNEIMEMVAGDGGVFGDTGDHGGALNSSDWYAPGDARVPKVLGAKKKRKKKKKGDGPKEAEFDEPIPMQRRVFPNM